MDNLTEYPHKSVRISTPTTPTTMTLNTSVPVSHRTVPVRSHSDRSGCAVPQLTCLYRTGQADNTPGQPYLDTMLLQKQSGVYHLLIHNLRVLGCVCVCICILLYLLLSGIITISVMRCAGFT